ncbi:MAG: phenylacetate--CoA ligase, partial [Tannerella sp.]|nr:phenylacetate--CoA ligase [Tannerella sp.]
MASSYWQEELETMNRDDLHRLQLERLRSTMAQASNSSFYKKVFEENGISAEDIQSLNDLKKLPFTTKDDLRSNYPFGLASI